MRKEAVAAALVVAALSTPTPSLKAQPARHNRGVSVRPTSDETPPFRLTLVGRTTLAVNYRPRGGKTKIDFAGTRLPPHARGDATIMGE